MANGYAGKILRINLTTKAISTIDTSKYEQWLGGAGMGAAIFWDLCTDKTVKAYDPKNVVTLTTGPLCATGAPSCPITIMQGIGSYTLNESYTRSCIGGHFGTMLKNAGFDGVILEGKAGKPTWISIINDQVTLNDASDAGDMLWGKKARETQEAVIAIMSKNHSYPNWMPVGTNLTTQRPAVLAISMSGENLGRNAAITGNAGASFSQGGFGGVWGSKNLKAIGVIGTNSISVADPAALVQTRIKWQNAYAYNVDNPVKDARPKKPSNSDPAVAVYSPSHLVGCPSCWVPCRKHSANNALNEVTCGSSHWYITATADDVIYRAQDLIDDYALNTNDMSFDDTFFYVLHLIDRGILGPGKKVDTGDLPIGEIKAGTYAGAEAYCRAIAMREGIGNDLAEGIARAAKKWGTYDADTKTGLLAVMNNGIVNHHTFTNVYWAYAQVLGDRDLNETSVQSYPTYLPLDQVISRYAAKLSPFNDPMMLDNSWQKADGSNMAQAKATGIYSEAKAKLVAWERYFCYGWIHSAGIFCKTAYPNLFGGNAPDFQGHTPDMELAYIKAVTGKDLKFTDIMDIGRKIFMLFRSIYAAQGRVRDDEVFTEFCYIKGDNKIDCYSDPGPNAQFSTAAREGQSTTSKNMAVYDGKAWSLQNNSDLFLDKAAFEEWKTKFYALVGLSTKTGQPTRATLEALGMKTVADGLAAAGRLGT
jgi:aldehyde:ferredoxin oxidoreductase